MDVTSELLKRKAASERWATSGLQALGEGRIAYLTKLADASPATIDTASMSITCVITTQDEDRSGDVIVTDGIDTASHERNPVVLYNHGLTLEKPIGKAEDQGGKYTVVREPNRLLGTVFFSQTLPEAAELFALAAEGILRGWSIGAIPRETAPRDVVGPDGMAALLVKSCEMFEFSLTPKPDNREALTERVMRAVSGGKPMSGVLLKSFEPWVLPASPMVVVPREVEMSATATITKADPPPKPEETADPKKPEYVPVDNAAKDTPAKAAAAPPATPPAADASQKKPDDPDTTAEPDPTADHPPGAKATAGIYDRMMEMCEFLGTAAKGQENPAMKDKIAELTEAFTAHAEEMKAFHGEHYSEYGDLGGKEEGDGDAESGGDEGKGNFAKTIQAKVKRVLLPYRKSILASVPKAGARDEKLTALEAEREKLRTENTALRKSLTASLDREEKVRTTFNKARNGK
jgi:hypothetical protein